MAQQPGCAGTLRPAGNRAGWSVPRGGHLVGRSHPRGRADETDAFLGPGRPRGVFTRPSPSTVSVAGVELPASRSPGTLDCGGARGVVGAKSGDADAAGHGTIPLSGAVPPK